MFTRHPCFGVFLGRPGPRVLRGVSVGPLFNQRLMSSIRNRIRIPTRNVGGSFEGSRIRYPRIDGSERPTIRENSRIVTAIRWLLVTSSNCISIDSPPIFIDNLNYRSYTNRNETNVIMVTDGMSRGACWNLSIPSLRIFLSCPA